MGRCSLLQSALDARRAANLGDRGSGSSMIFVNALVVAIMALILAALTTLRQFTTVTGRFQALHHFLTQDKVTSFSWGVVGDVLLAVCIGPLSTILNVFSERHFDIIFEINTAYVMGITPFCLLLPMPETRELVPRT